MEPGQINKYLGASLGNNITKQQQDDFCTHKISKRLGVWETNLLSFETSTILIQFVLQAQPTFYSSLIKLSAKTCRKVEQLYRQFLLGYNKEGKAKKSLIQ